MASNCYNAALNERHCSLCNKLFYPNVVDEWAYRQDGKLFCSWHCLRAYQKDRPIKIKFTHYANS